MWGLRDLGLHLSAASLAGNTGMFEVDVSAGTMSVSAEAAAISGLGPSTLAGTPWATAHALIHEDDRAGVEAANAEAISRPGTMRSDVYRIRRADTGDVRWIRRAVVVLENQPDDVVRAVGSITDITDRLLAEQTARDAEVTMGAALDAAPETIIVVRSIHDADGRFADAEILFVNESGRRRWFGSRPLEELRGRREFETWPAYRELLFDIYASVAESGKPFREIREFPVPDIGPRTFEITVSPFATGLVHVGRDVTEHQRSEEALRVADARRRRFFEANVIGTVIAGVDGQVLEANDYWLELVGRTRAELERGEIDWRAATTPESLADDERSLAEVRDRGTSEPYEKAYIRPDGTRVWALVVRASMPGMGEQVAAFVLDLTRQKSADARTAKLAAAIEQTNDSVVITDPDGTIQYVNPAFEAVSRYTREEAVGRNPRILKSGAHGPAFYAAMWAALAAGETWRGDLTNRRKDGSLYTEAASITPVLDAAGRTTAYVGVKRDVSEERQVQAALRESEERFAQVFGGVDAILSYYDARGLAVLLGPQTERILGFRPDELAPFEAWRARIHPEDAERCRGTWFDRTITNWDLEYRMRRADEAWIWVQDHGVRVLDSDGRFERQFSIITDVTVRHAAEERERRLLRVQTAAADIDRAIARADNRDQLLDEACRLAVEVGGFKLAWAGTLDETSAEHEVHPTAAAGEALGFLEGYRVAFDPNRIDGHMPGLAAVRDNRIVVVRMGDAMSTDIRDRVARWGIRSAAIAPLRVDGRPTGVLSVYHADVDAFDASMTSLVERIADDVSSRLASIALEDSRRAAEEALRASDELQRRVFEAMAEGVVVYDRSGVIVSANAAAAHLFGVGESSMTGAAALPAGWTLRHEGGEPFEAEAYPVAVALRTGEPCRDVLMHLEGEGGRSRWVRVSAAPLRGPDGGVTGVVSSISDITNERELEGQLRQSQRLEAVGRLAGGVAHDFNNLLTAIRGYTEIARAGLGRNSPVEGDLLEVLAAAERASALTRQLLLFARRQRLEPRAVDAALAIDGIAGMLRHLLGEQVTLSVVHDAGAHLIRIDPGQFDQVIVNLAVNARDAMPDGGELRITTERWKPEDQAPTVRITVADTGTGMDATTLEHLFTPFFTTKPQDKGTGLGLATVHGIVTASGGSISVASGLGHGTTFTISLPADVEPAPPPEALPTAVPPGGGPSGGPIILLVEDDAAVRDVTARMLRGLGYRVTTATGGAEALELASAPGAQVDLLLSDVRMPGIQGPELVTRVREARPSLRALLVTGYAEDDDWADRLEDVTVLQKPFDRRGLGVAVQDALG